MLENIEIAQEEHHVPHGLLPGTNLAWKDIVLCQMWMVNQKRMRGMERMSMGKCKFGHQD